MLLIFLSRSFQEIPKFYPILKSALNQPGLRDPPETTCRISARPISKFSYRFQEHLFRCANHVSTEQASLENTIKDVSLVSIAAWIQ